LCVCKTTARADFFFSSRRRHTISKRDWSSDVCSSDLEYGGVNVSFPPASDKASDRIVLKGSKECVEAVKARIQEIVADYDAQVRSEERRVGEECMPWMWQFGQQDTTESVDVGAHKERD